MSDARYSTSDMALVAWLSCQHFSHSEVEMVDSTVTWFYNDSQALQRELDVYRRGDAKVEPKQFMLQVSRVRHQMHAVFDTV